MNITQVIAKLSQIRAFHGDAEVDRWNQCCCYDDDAREVDEVEFDKDSGRVVVS